MLLRRILFFMLVGYQKKKMSEFQLNLSMWLQKKYQIFYLLLFETDQRELIWNYLLRNIISIRMFYFYEKLQIRIY